MEGLKACLMQHMCNHAQPNHINPASILAWSFIKCVISAAPYQSTAVKCVRPTSVCSSLNFKVFDMITKVDTKAEIRSRTLDSFGSYLTEWWLAYTVVVVLYKKKQTINENQKHILLCVDAMVHYYTCLKIRYSKKDF